MYQQATSTKYKGVADGRVGVIELSVGRWMQQVVLTADEKSTWAPLRRLYVRLRDEPDNVSEDDLKEYNKWAHKLFIEAIETAHVCLCTTAMYAASEIQELKTIAIAILDDAGKAVETEVIAILGHKRCRIFVFIGDPRQLRPFVRETAEENKLVPQRHLSLFERLIRNGFPYVILKEQYRMIEEIGSIVSNVFYNGQLRTAATALATSEARHEKVQATTDFNKTEFAMGAPCLFVEVSNGKEKKKKDSKYNIKNTTMVMQTAISMVRDGVAMPEDIVILPMYTASRETYMCAQYMAAQDHPDLHLNGVRINTSDSFQGAEADLVLIDLTVADGIGFLSKSNRLNVAISRAKLGLWIFGTASVRNKASDAAAKHLGKVVDAFRDQGCVTKGFTVNEIPGYIKEPTSAEFHRTVKKFQQFHGDFDDRLS